MTWPDGRNERRRQGTLASKTRTTGGREFPQFDDRQETVWHKREQRSKDMLLAGSFNPDFPSMRRIF
jgi:hypothetical protein